jgi:hypothetical protein
MKYSLSFLCLLQRVFGLLLSIKIIDKLGVEFDLIAKLHLICSTGSGGCGGVGGGGTNIKQSLLKKRKKKK